MSVRLTKTLTIRLPAPAMKRVRDKAREAHLTPSELVRRAIEKEFGGSGDGNASLLARTSRWVGAVKESKVTAARDTREDLDSWEPDRRG